MSIKIISGDILNRGVARRNQQILSASNYVKPQRDAVIANKNNVEPIVAEYTMLNICKILCYVILP